jgi:hypothetical protein
MGMRNMRSLRWTVEGLIIAKNFDDSCDAEKALNSNLVIDLIREQA